MSLWNREVPGKERQLWLLTAMTAPLLRVAGGMSWSMVAILGIGCLAACYGLELLRGTTELPDWLEWVQAIWMAPVIARVMQWVGDYWGEERAIPVVLLLLAMWTATKGAQVAARAVNALRWIVILILAGIFLASVKEIRWENWSPSWDWSRWDLVLVYLIPAICPVGTEDRITSKGKLLAFGLAASLVTTGVMTIGCRENAFYEMCRSLTLFGSAKRMESLASAALTMGFFGLLVLLMQAVGVKEGKVGKMGVITGLSLILYLFPLPVSDNIVPVSAVFSWILVPAIYLVSKKLKNFEKTS